MELDAYLHFNGNCKEALDFYAHVFGGRIDQIKHFDEAPAEFNVPAESRSRVMHARFSSPTLKFMASDSMSGVVRSGNRITLSLVTRDMHDGERVFNELAQDGTVVHPFTDMFWNAKFGQVTDRFGIDWMVNAEKV
jgi:PhnB protein